MTVRPAPVPAGVLVLPAGVLVFLVGVLVFLAGGVAGAAAGETFRQTTLTIFTDKARLTLPVELATTSDQRRQGLQGRRMLAQDGGMLFDFGRSRPISMWMKDTLISLDMLFIRSDGVIESIVEQTEPHSLKIIRSKGEARAVLELNAGSASRLGIRAGHRVAHRIFDRAPNLPGTPRAGEPSARSE